MKWTRAVAGVVVLFAVAALAGAPTVSSTVKVDWDRWVSLLDDADAAIANKSAPDVTAKALEAMEPWLVGHRENLEKHPDFPASLERYYGLRLSLTKLYANMGFLFAKTAADKKDPSYLTRPGGGFTLFQRADDTLKSYFAQKGQTADGDKMKAYVAELRVQFDKVAEHYKVTAPASVPASTTAIDKGTEGYFRQWWEKLDAVDAALTAGNAKEAAALHGEAVRHQEGWNGWLKKHSEYERALQRQTAQGGKLSQGAVQGHIDQALTMARKAYGEKNGNFFGEHAGPAQQLDYARKALADLVKARGDADPEVKRLQAAIDEAAKEIQQKGGTLEREALEARAMPADVYGGSDKAALKAAILAHWKQKFPNDKVLGVRFFESNWTRETNWKSNATSIYKSDYSWLPVKVVVQQDEEVAVLYPAFANKQHQSSDKVVISDDHGGAGYVVAKMLMKNVKF